MSTQTIGIIRDRGQLTIPNTIREVRAWATPSSVVTISTDNPDEIVIRPKKEVDWDKVWEMIKKSRSIKGKATMSAAEFLEKDRRSH